MKKALIIVSSLILLLSSCGRGVDDPAPEAEGNTGSAGPFVEEIRKIDTLECPESLLDRFSYAYGNLFAGSLETLTENISPEYFVKGFLDAHGDSFFTEEEIEDIFIEFQSLMISEEQKRFDDEKVRNLEEANSFLKVNGMRTGVHETKSGLQYERIKEMDSLPEPRLDSTVVMDYTMTLLSGSVVESSYDRDSKAIIKVNELPPGFAEALMLMSPGDKYRFWIPPELAFGPDGSMFIGPNELVIFEATLHEVQ